MSSKKVRNLAINIAFSNWRDHLPNGDDDLYLKIDAEEAEILGMENVVTIGDQLYVSFSYVFQLASSQAKEEN